MAKWVKTYRSDVVKNITSAIETLKKKGRSEAEIIFGVVKRFHPSKMEFSHCYCRIQVNQKGEPNYYAMRTGNQLIRLYNRKQEHDQEIIGIKKIEVAANGKQVKRSLLDIAYGNYAAEAASDMIPIINGCNEKVQRLNIKARNTRTVKRAADKLEQQIFNTKK